MTHDFFCPKCFRDKELLADMKWHIIKSEPVLECSNCKLLWNSESLLKQLKYIEEDLDNLEIVANNQSWNFLTKDLTFRNSTLSRLYHSFFLLKDKNIAPKIAEYELCKLLETFSLPTAYKDPIIDIFKKIWIIFNPNRVYKEPSYLCPLIFYFFCKFSTIPIDTHKLIEASCLTEELFLCFTFQVFEYLINTLDQKVSDFSLENEYWFPEFDNFLNIIDYYNKFCLNQCEKGRRYILKLYFDIKPKYKKKLIRNIKEGKACSPDNFCLFRFKDYVNKKELERRQE
ncbi:MAG: hypothetical protein ACFFDX_14595 [Candidatus Odinarchaeota archaeon]